MRAVVEDAQGLPRHGVALDLVVEVEGVGGEVPEARDDRFPVPLPLGGLRPEDAVRLFDEVLRVVELDPPSVGGVGPRDEPEIVRPARGRDDRVGDDPELRRLHQHVRGHRLPLAAEGGAREPAAAVPERDVEDLLSRLELDVADAERLARHEGLGEPVRVLDELVLPDDRGLALLLPRFHRGLDLRVVRADELPGRRRRLRCRGAGRLDERDCPGQVLLTRPGLVHRGAAGRAERSAEGGQP